MEWTQAAMFWATVGLVLVSIYTATISYFLLRGNLDPHVIVYAKLDENRPSIIVLVIENIGALHRSPSPDHQAQIDAILRES